MVNPMQRYSTIFSIIVCLLAVAACKIVWADNKQISAWRGTGLDLTFLDKWLTNERCSSSKREFLSCIGATQAVLDVHGKELQVVPFLKHSESDSNAKLVGLFGTAAVVQDRSLRVNMPGNALEVIRARRHRIMHWHDWLRSNPRPYVDFSGIHAWLIAEIIDPKRVEEFALAAINGYLSIADAHARVAHNGGIEGGPDRQRGTYPKGSKNELVYTGIGAGIQPVVDAALVTSVVRGGPADKAGLQVHDFILTVNEQPVMGLTAEALVEKLRGQSGTKVMLGIKRQQEILEISIVRDAVAVKNVVSYGFVDRGWQFAYMKIDSFLDADTCSEVHHELKKQHKPTLNGIILDLRDNAGGLIDQAVCVADLFLPQEEIVVEIRDVRKPNRTERKLTRYDARVRDPMVTLVNATTGSASEVLVGALQDHNRSIVVGELTFGKGTVQTTRPWRGSSSILEFFTIARYYRPSGVGVQLVGIKPDIQTSKWTNTSLENRIVLREYDLFPTALSKESKVWEHPNPEAIAAIRECTDKEGLALRRLSHDKEQGRMTDLPLVIGQDALVCRLTRRI